MRSHYTFSAFLLVIAFSFGSRGTIPSTHLKGIDELFPAEHQLHSPLTGMLFHDSFVEKAIGMKDEPIGVVANLLFQLIAEEEIYATNMASAPGSHLTPSVIGHFVKIYETHRKLPMSDDDLRKSLRSAFKESLTSDPEYQSSLDAAEREGEKSAKEDPPKDTKKRKAHQARYDVRSAKFQEKVTNLVDAIVESYATYEFGTPSDPELSFATTILLNSYMWKKYADKSHLQGYLRVMAEAGLLTPKARGTLNEKFFADIYTSDDLRKIAASVPALRRSQWVRDNFAAAIVTAIENGGEASFPRITPFIRVLWALYSRYADCCEIVIHVLFDMLAYNPQTNEIDYRMLESLKQKYYPNMSSAILGYYKKYPTYASQQSIQARGEWVHNMEGLGADIAYGYEDKQCEVLPPAKNLLKVVYRLLGYDDINGDYMTEIFNRVREVSGFSVVYSELKPKHKDSTLSLFTSDKNKLYLTTLGTRHAYLKLKKPTSNKGARRITKVIAKEQLSGQKDDPIEALRYRGAKTVLQ